MNPALVQVVFSVVFVVCAVLWFRAESARDRCERMVRYHRTPVTREADSTYAASASKDRQADLKKDKQRVRATPRG